MTANDILKILNLKHAWEFILNENVIQSSTNYSLLCQINKNILSGFFYNAGEIRNVPVQIGGTKWTPDTPIESQIKEEIENIFNKESDIIDIAIEILIYIMKKQIFIDGNKRTAIIFANHFLIANGSGLIAIPEELVEKYKKLLIKYYEGNNEEIKTFLKEKCWINIEI